MYICVYMHVDTCIYAHVCTYIYICTCIIYMYIYIFTPLHLGAWSLGALHIPLNYCSQCVATQYRNISTPTSILYNHQKGAGGEAAAPLLVSLYIYTYIYIYIYIYIHILLKMCFVLVAELDDSVLCCNILRTIEFTIHCIMY